MAITKPSIRCPHCGHYHSNYKSVLTQQGVKYYCAKCGKQLPSNAARELNAAQSARAVRAPHKNKRNNAQKEQSCQA
jgi:DNA-directed RNA polymerase subunit RPC12/RpoP